MKKFLIAAIALVCVSLAWAYVEKTEIMTVIKTDGSKIELNVDDIELVSFSIDENSYGLVISDANGAE